MVTAFTEGAEAAGNEVREMYIDGMNIASCKACEACSHNGGYCPQKDDMELINEAYIWADIIVFASPMYWGYITGQLKTTVDRLYAVQNRLGYASEMLLYTIIKLWLLQRSCKVFLCFLPQFGLVVL